MTYREFLATETWRKLRSEVFAREGGFCERCGAAGTQVHHRSYCFGWAPPLFMLELLCRDCHDAEHMLTFAQLKERINKL